MQKSNSANGSVFKSEGFSTTIEKITSKIASLYKIDKDPWVIGYSGGKDSTAIVQLVWMALEKIPENERTKPVYVVTTDTLVENPVVAAWVENSLKQISVAAEEQSLPFDARLLHPAVADSFWVNLIGRGYPAPRNKFRWCTERLKIKPTSTFIEAQASKYGEVILFLGTRRAESSTRAANIDKHAAGADSEFGLTPHPKLAGCLVYSPISDWSNDDVWQFLLSIQNPWGYDNNNLMSMYRGASADNECPVVIDTSTPSCGSSRFGCWVCTLVDEDKSMSAMIQNDHEKEWLLPLLNFRNQLDFRGDQKRLLDRERRDFRRMTGSLTSYTDFEGNLQLVPGPYTQDSRSQWLTELLETQEAVRAHPDTPEAVRDIELITYDELREIRRMWLEDKHEIEDLLPGIYESVTGEQFVDVEPDPPPFELDMLTVLKDKCGNDRMQYEMARNLLDIEWRHRFKGRRYGLFDDLLKTINSCMHTDRDEALEHKRWENLVMAEAMTVNGEPIESGNSRSDLVTVSLPEAQIEISVEGQSLVKG